MPRVQVVTATSGIGAVGRKIRSPRHSFAASQQPYEIRPFFIAPVLPGETMKHLSVQATMKSGLLYEHLTGWWAEHFFFYVKHRDLAQRDLLTNLHVANITDPSLITPPDPIWGHAGGINWMKLCTIRCVEEFFRNEGETWDNVLSPDGLPLASINQDDWLDSAVREGAHDSADQDELPSDAKELAMLESTSVVPGFESHYDHWLTMRRNNLVQVDFEDYLRANGIRVQEEDRNPHRPELLRYIRAFTTPKRAISPLGEEASRLEWDFKESADKDRLFKEPGFVIGLSVVRPKVYPQVNGTASGLMSDAFTWLPATLQDNPETSLRIIPAGLALQFFPGYQGAEDIIVDMRDLFLYGENLRLGPNGNARAVIASVPDAEFDRRYAHPGLAEDWWFQTGAATPPETFSLPPSAFLSEGIVKLQIASRLQGDSSGHGQQMNPAVLP